MIRRGLILRPGALALALAILFGGTAYAENEIAGTSFEEPNTGGQYTDTGDASVDHALANNAGEADVNFTSVGGELGFAAFYTNTRNGTGLTDGDFCGVTSFTGTVGAYTDGSRGYQIQDADGLMTVTLDTVDLSSYSASSVQVDIFVQSTGYESDDRIKVWLETDGADVILLDTAGTDIDDLLIEGRWITLTGDLSGFSDATLKFELDSNASDESIYIDNVRFYDSVVEGQDPVASEVTIMQIQGAGHVSPYDGELVRTTGVVTAIAFNGFYLQDAAGDGDDATSDGIFVLFSSPSSAVAVGDELELVALVDEDIPGGAATGNLSTTQLTNAFIAASTSNAALPTPVIIGTGGRLPDNRTVISSDETPVNLQDGADDAANNFDPENDAIDFFESIEGMLVTVQSPVCVSPVRVFSAFSAECFTLPNNGADVAPTSARTARGGIELQPDPDNTGDQNPERVQIQFDGTLYPSNVPELVLGDKLGDVTGVVGYSFGNYEVNATVEVEVTPSGLQPEVSLLTTGRNDLLVASYNVLNLGPDGSDDDQRDLIASQIAYNMNGPDIIALQEIQDDSGETDDGITSADETLQALIDAIALAGGPTYAYVDVAPMDGSSGGVPGGNIRNAFLYNPDRVSLLTHFALSPSVLTLIGATNPDAFEGTRTPLVGVFGFRGRQFVVVNNHFTSRFGSTPIFGGPQPFLQVGEPEREGQAQAVNEFVNQLLCWNRNERVIVCGDLNTFQWTNDLADIMTAGQSRKKCKWGGKWCWRWLRPRKSKPILKNLINTVTDDNVYTFIFDGNSQALDHFFVSRSLWQNTKLDIVHVNVDFFRGLVGSDHEPLLARIKNAGRSWWRW